MKIPVSAVIVQTGILIIRFLFGSLSGVKLRERPLHSSASSRVKEPYSDAPSMVPSSSIVDGRRVTKLSLVQKVFNLLK